MRIRTVALAIGIIGLFLLAIWYFSAIFWYIIISLVLATILRSLTNHINQTQIFNFSVPRIFGVLISFMVLIVFIAALVIVFLPLISEQVQNLANLNWHNLYDKVTDPVEAVEEFLISNNLSDEPPGFLTNNIWTAITGFAGSTNLRIVINNTLKVATGFFIGVLAVTFITFMLLYEKGLLKRVLIGMIPNQYFELLIAAVYKIEKLLSNYLLGLFLQIISIFTMAALGLSIFGIKYALSIALFAAVANLIPYAGPLLGAIFGIAVGLSTGDVLLASQESLVKIIGIISVFIAIQITDNLVIQPVIFSKSVMAHPLEIFVIIFAGATVGGIVGMIIAIPTYTILTVSVLELFHGYKQYHIFRTS